MYNHDEGVYDPDAQHPLKLPVVIFGVAAPALHIGSDIPWLRLGTTSCYTV